MKHFTVEELTASRTAQKRGILNAPTSEERESLVALIDNILDPVREHMGRPVVVTSGFRCQELNAAVGGVSSSQHIRGEAADITCYDRDLNRQIFEYIRENLNFDQLINEHDYSWVHVSYTCGGGNRYNRRQTFNVE